MNNKRVFIGFGELAVDKLYDKQGNLLKQDGGDTTWNILYHLGLMGEETYAVGACGNDENTQIAFDSLKRAKVNTDYIQIQDKKTNVIYSTLEIEKNGKPKIEFFEKSPFEGQSSFEMSKSIPTILPEELKKRNIIVILMDLDSQNLEFINGIENKKVALDLGHVEFFENLDSTYILEFLKKVDICQLNGDVVNELLKKLNVKNELELYKLLNPELLVITYGIDGAKFLYKENEEVKEIKKKPLKVVKNASDTSGAGDAFLSVILKSYNILLSNNRTFDESSINDIFNLANLFSCQIIQKIGCRASRKNLSEWLKEYKMCKEQIGTQKKHDFPIVEQEQENEFRKCSKFLLLKVFTSFILFDTIIQIV